MWKMILVQLISSMTPAVVSVGKSAASEMYRAAKDTENPYDDIGAGMLCALFGVNTKEVK